MLPYSLWEQFEEFSVVSLNTLNFLRIHTNTFIFFSQSIELRTTMSILAMVEIASLEEMHVRLPGSYSQENNPKISRL